MANFPASVSTNANLYIAVNGLQTTLAASILATDTTIQLTSTSNFPATGFVTIDNSEVVKYTGVSGSNLTGCSRGADGTTAAPHSLGVTVGLTIVAAHHNFLKDEIIAIETALGAGFALPLSVANGGTGTTTSTGTGSVVLSTSPTLVTPNLGTPSAAVLTNATGLPLTTGVTGTLPDSNTTATPNATPSTIVERDANGNTKVNTLVENFSTTVTAAGTTTLTASSSPIQQFTGTTTQTVKLPNATTLSIGYQITVLNRSTGVVTVNDNSNGLVQNISAGAQTTFTVTNIGSAAGVWDASTSSGSGGVVAQYQEYTIGTASGTYTGSLTVVNLPFSYVANNATLQVIYNGQVLTVGIDYVETNSTTVTFNYSLVSGGIIAFKSLSGGAVSNSVVYVREDYVVGTALNNYTGSTTVFNLVNTYVTGSKSLLVYVDGDLQTLGASVDYLETNNLTVTFNNALVSGQKVAFLFSQPVAPGGSVNSATTGQVAYYPLSSNVISGSDALKVDLTNGNGIIKGTTTNDNAAAGKVGEYVSANVTRAAAVTYVNSTAFVALTSISLTAGDWDVTGQVGEFGGTATTGFDVEVYVGVQSNGSDGVYAVNIGETTSTSNGNGDTAANIPAVRMSLSATTTVYLSVVTQFTTGSAKVYGRISARRVR